MPPRTQQGPANSAPVRPSVHINWASAGTPRDSSPFVTCHHSSLVVAMQLVTSPAPRSGAGGVQGKPDVATCGISDSRVANTGVHNPIRCRKRFVLRLPSSFGDFVAAGPKPPEVGPKTAASPPLGPAPGSARFPFSYFKSGHDHLHRGRTTRISDFPDFLESCSRGFYRRVAPGKIGFWGAQKAGSPKEIGPPREPAVCWFCWFLLVFVDLYWF